MTDEIQYRRDIEEFALRMMATQRDWPQIDHRGTEPEVLRAVPQAELSAIRMEFERR